MCSASSLLARANLILEHCTVLHGNYLAQNKSLDGVSHTTNLSNELTSSARILTNILEFQVVACETPTPSASLYSFSKYLGIRGDINALLLPGISLNERMMFDDV